MNPFPYEEKFKRMVNFAYITKVKTTSLEFLGYQKEVLTSNREF